MVEDSVSSSVLVRVRVLVLVLVDVSLSLSSVLEGRGSVVREGMLREGKVKGGVVVVEDSSSVVRVRVFR